MKNWIWRGALAAAIASPALSGFALAESTGCSNATLKGDYAFSVVDFTTPLVVVGIGTFDGKGGFSQVDYRGDSLTATPPVQNFTGGETGSYHVNSNCTAAPVLLQNAMCRFRSFWDRRAAARRFDVSRRFDASFCALPREHL